MPPAGSIAVWPETLEFSNQEKTLVVYNNLDVRADYRLILKELETGKESFSLEPSQSIPLKLLLKDNEASIIIEETTGKGQNVINSIEIPVNSGIRQENTKKRYYFGFLLLLIVIPIFILKKKYLNKKKTSKKVLGI